MYSGSITWQVKWILFSPFLRTILPILTHCDMVSLIILSSATPISDWLLSCLFRISWIFTHDIPAEVTDDCDISKCPCKPIADGILFLTGVLFITILLSRIESLLCLVTSVFFTLSSFLSFAALLAVQSASVSHNESHDNSTGDWFTILISTLKGSSNVTFSWSTSITSMCRSGDAFSNIGSSEKDGHI